MNNDLRVALEALEKEKGIKKEVLLSAIYSSLATACKNHFGYTNNIKIDIDPDTYEYSITMEKEIIPDDEEIINDLTEIHFEDAKNIIIDKIKKENKHITKNDLKIRTDEALLECKVGETIECPIDAKSFGHIATQNAKGVVVQKIREEERNSVYYDMKEKENQVISGIVGREQDKFTIINLGRVDAMLMEQEKIKGEKLKQGDKIKVFVQDVTSTPKGPRIKVSRTSPMLVTKLFENEVPEMIASDGKEPIIEIKSIAREPGSRTKIAVFSKDPNVDAVGSCVGLNGVRVNAVVDELHGEKIDIMEWSDNPSFLIENALAPSKVILVVSDEETKTALVIVPDNQLSLAIGKEGQNARLAAKLTDYKIDIKSETVAKDTGIFDDLGIEYNKTNSNNNKAEDNE